MGQLIGFMLLVGLVLTYWQIALATVVVVLVIRAAPVAWREFQSGRDEAQHYAEMTASRADVEDAMYVRGDDERGLYRRWDGVHL